MADGQVVIDFKGNDKDLKDKTLSTGDLIKSNLASQAIIGGVKALASGIGSVVKGLISVGKASLQAYGDYQQLAGGIETLFKDSSDTMKQYAQNAYKTAGLSANQYMETATSFSASLLQSVGGDTQKAAQITDMAIRDMSDNANKLGTDMSMIQSAYQGFAKQNYTMLDNLKLGYGGTKSEMERLLADATKISGVKYDISNLNDVYNAIHVIQEEMEITGTTQKEAGTTIQGSLNQVKGAWNNLLVAFASPEVDVNTAISNLVESLFGDGSASNLGLFGNVLPAINTIGNSMAKAIPSIINSITARLPELVNTGMEIINSILNGLIQAFPQIAQSAVNLLMLLAQSLIENLPAIMQAGITLILELVKGITQAIPTLIPAIVQAIFAIQDAILDNFDTIIDCGIELIIALAEGLIVALPQLIDRMPVIITKMVNALVNNFPKLLEAGVKLVVQLANGLIKAIPNVVKAVPQIISALVNGLGNSLWKLGEVGGNLIKGLWNGISNMAQWLYNKIKGLGQGVLNAVKSIFGIHSPSAEFAFIGKMNILGLEKGMEDMKSDLYATFEDVMGLSPDFNSISQFNNAPNVVVNVNNSYETDPLGQMVRKVKTFSGGAKNDYSYGYGG